MIAVSSRQSVSGPIRPTVRLLLARWICVCNLGAGHIYIHIRIYTTGPETLIHRAISSLAVGMIGPDTLCLELTAIIPLSLHISH